MITHSTVTHFLLLCILRGSDSITVSSNKNIQEAIFTSEIPRLPDSKNFNYTVLLTCIVIMCLYAGSILAIMGMSAFFRVCFMKKVFFAYAPKQMSFLIIL